MWCLETLEKINKEAYRLADLGLSEQPAMENIGIRILGNTPHRVTKPSPQRMAEFLNALEEVHEAECV